MTDLERENLARDYFRKTKFFHMVKLKGWKMGELAQRWGITDRQLRNISAAPRTRDMDALNGLPMKGVDDE